MKQQGHRRSGDWCGARATMLSRRGVVGSSGLALLGLLSGSVLGQEKKEPQGKPGRDGRERMEEFNAYAERMRNASPEERMRIMEERRVQDQRRAIEDFKVRLGVSDKDWPAIKPRIERVYTLVHPLPQMGTGSERPRTEVQRRSSELRDLLRSEGAAVDRIKAALAVLRAAKEKAAQELAAAKQDLRQLMTVRQEAELVLSGLLD
jgi:hypothetical protein